jgi:hypothetical protein
MDPWLEDADVFPSVHNFLISMLQEALTAVLPPGYVATSANRVWVDDDSRREPDVSVFGRERRTDRGDGTRLAAGMSRAGLLAVAPDPVSDPWREPFLEIRSNRGKRLVTAVEVLSRSNKKPGDNGRNAYLLKQDEYRLSGVNLVELDLLRAGSHTTVVPAARLRQLAGGFDYHACVTVALPTEHCYAVPFQLADPLPDLPIPLDGDVEPVTVRLQPLFDRCYDSTRYPELVRYDQPPDPPLSPEQAEWAAAVLRAKGLLPGTEG